MEPRGKILPVYFVADQSGSMYDHIGELNDGLNSLMEQLQVEVFAASKIRFNLIGFTDTTARYLENVDFSEIDEMPELGAEGLTAYGACFGHLADTIPGDVQELKDQGFAVHRPAVFFLTDGLPCGEPDGFWEDEYQRLMALREHPNILAFGIGDADADIIRQVATKPQFAFMQKEGVDTGAALVEFVKSLTQSIINSGTALAAGDTQLKIEKPDDFLVLDAEEL